MPARAVRFRLYHSPRYPLNRNIEFLDVARGIALLVEINVIY